MYYQTKEESFLHRAAHERLVALTMNAAASGYNKTEIAQMLSIGACGWVAEYTRSDDPLHLVSVG